MPLEQDSVLSPYVLHACMHEFSYKLLLHTHAYNYDKPQAKRVAYQYSPKKMNAKVYSRSVDPQ